tara:strand:- start:1096 stop:1245 length:150 start_codon:yes stop_codon:yes gene_type:complete
MSPTAVPPINVYTVGKLFANIPNRRVNLIENTINAGIKTKKCGMFLIVV